MIFCLGIGDAKGLNLRGGVAETLKLSKRVIYLALLLDGSGVSLRLHRSSRRSDWIITVLYQTHAAPFTTHHRTSLALTISFILTRAAASSLLLPHEVWLARTIYCIAKFQITHLMNSAIWRLRDIHARRVTVRDKRGESFPNLTMLYLKQ